MLVDARLARRLRQGGAGATRRSLRAGEAEREGRAPRRSTSPTQTNAPAAALNEGDAALRDGRRRQADRGRGIARGDAREGPRHAGHARAIIEGLIVERYIHREGQELIADGEGVLADDAAARPRRAGAVLARSSPASGSSSSRRWSTASSSATAFMTRNRRDDRAHRRAGEELRERHDPRRFRDAHGAVPEVRRRGAREVQEIPVLRCDFALLEDPRRPAARARRGRDAAARARGRPARRASAASWAGRSPRSSS